MKINKLILSVAILGFASTAMIHASVETDTEAFWRKAVELFDKAGYDIESEFGKHARSNLQRVQTLHAHEATVPAIARKSAETKPVEAKALKKAKNEKAEKAAKKPRAKKEAEPKAVAKKTAALKTNKAATNTKKRSASKAKLNDKKKAKKVKTVQA